jgi:hypothetical protein
MTMSWPDRMHARQKPGPCWPTSTSWRCWAGARLDLENRAAIVRIKESLLERPGERIRSYLVYEAVLDHGIRTADAFEVWWNTRSRPT